MVEKDRINKVLIANVLDNELKEIQSLEKKLDDKYYLIAFDRNNVT